MSFLGESFPNEEARRKYYQEQLAKQLQEPAFRRLAGFPLLGDEQILRCSDPPYYTACPNPFFHDFVCYYGRPYNAEEPIQSSPLTDETPERRHHPIGLAHSYHTKTSYQTIATLLRHYSRPGDLVLDCFCGSGMTGVAVQAVNEEQEEQCPGARPRRFLQLDLSPAATRLAYAYTLPLAPQEVLAAARFLLQELEEEWGWLYHYEGAPADTHLTSVVWCDVYLCPSCGSKMLPWNPKTEKALQTLSCPGCQRSYSQLASLPRLEETYDDPLLHCQRQRPKRQDLLFRFGRPGQRKNKHLPPAAITPPPASQIAQAATDAPPKILPLPYMHMTHERNNLAAQGIEYLHDFFPLRAYLLLSSLSQRVLEHPPPTQQALWMWVNSTLLKLSRLLCYNSDGIGRVMKGVYYVPRVGVEGNPFHYLRLALRQMERLWRFLNRSQHHGIIGTASATALPLPPHSIDYIFLDPPFGGFQLYSDLNFLWEGFLGAYTNRDLEITVDQTQQKGEEEYQSLLTQSLAECFRVLKPGRWITVKFHNSSRSIWLRVQQALEEAGFALASVSVSDKTLGTLKQILDPATVRQDLLLSAQKPGPSSPKPRGNTAEHKRPEETATAEDGGCWHFVQRHLESLPWPVPQASPHLLAERQQHQIYNRMVAYHLQQGWTVPLSAGEFFAGLARRFPQQDGLYFTVAQNFSSVASSKVE